MVECGMSWQNEARDDIGQWSLAMPKDADGNVIDWQWVGSLALAQGIGCLTSGDSVEALSAQRSSPNATVRS